MPLCICPADVEQKVEEKKEEGNNEHWFNI
jgi:hypothetical protein